MSIKYYFKEFQMPKKTNQQSQNELLSSNYCSECKPFEVTTLLCQCKKSETSVKELKVKQPRTEQNKLSSYSAIDSPLILSSPQKVTNIEMPQIETLNNPMMGIHSKKVRFIRKEVPKILKAKINNNWGRPKNTKRQDHNFNKKYVNTLRQALKDQPQHEKILIYMKYQHSPFCHYLIADLFRSQKKLPYLRQILAQMEGKFKADILAWGNKHNCHDRSKQKIRLLDKFLSNLHKYIEQERLSKVTPHGLKVIALIRANLLLSQLTD